MFAPNQISPPVLIVALSLLSTSAPTTTLAQLPDAFNSFYVPEAGPVAAPLEGNAAIRFFRSCPNNDGGASLPQSVRIKVYLRDAFNKPIPLVTNGEICILYNGGTAAQGFFGPGADEVIANSTWNVAPLCPDLRCLEADAPTDANGTTYVTFTGPDPAAPGVGMRSAGRKWGHYDSNTPVFARGVQITGRLTPASAAGSYSLLIRSFDSVGGLGAAFNLGEVVTISDLNAVAFHVGEVAPPATPNYWRDFDNSGAIEVTDFNMVWFHLNHDCDTPLDP